MKGQTQAQMKKTPFAFSFGILVLVLLLSLSLVGAHTQSPNPAPHGVVPLHTMAPGQWVEKVWGDPSKAGEPFVIRIHNDAGYIVLPHTHVIDENITVVQGSWAVGMGARFDRAGLEPMELGSFGIVPKNMAHFGWAKTETIVQVHGIGPFSSTLIDPVYEITDKGVFQLTSLLMPGTPTTSSPANCFALKVGAKVRSAAGDGIVVSARCSPANQIAQYWIQKPNSERFWATLQELKPL
jgi:hypothetical protein